MDRPEALKLLRRHVRYPNLVKHMIAVGGIMRRLARHFGEDERRWELAGLLHDIDYEYTKENPERHPEMGVKILREYGFNDEEVLHAILAHNEKTPLETLMDKSLYVADPTSGFIVAAALIKPEKNLDAIDVPFLLRRFKEKGFARGASREQMGMCEPLLGLRLEQFFTLALEGMREVREELGL
ncbi:MAG: HD domain-containing protein [Thermotogae bacterium]|nr:HD domain-containing protein [Thermotogota bacterium]